MRILLLYNPIAGKNGGREDFIGKAVYELNCVGYEVLVYQTQSKEDIQRYMKAIDKSQCDMLVCCGGDGTLHEVVNAVMNQKIEIPVGYIPKGSTNDYAKNLGINETNVLECLKKKRTSWVDVGSFNGEYFNYVAAFGAFTNVSYMAPQESKNSLGYLAYLLEGIKRLSEIMTYHVKCKTDDKFIEDDILVGMITNSISIAGIKNKNNHMKLDDGLLEYIFIKMPQNIFELQTIVVSLLNSKVDERYMYYGKSKKFHIESEPVAWTLDGENGGITEFAEIDTCCRAFNIIVGDEFLTNET